MKKVYIAIIVIFFSFLISNAYSQKIPLINSGEIIEKAVELHDEGEYKEAIELYKKINRNDTNYLIALTELSMSYLADSNFEEAIKTAQEGLRIDPFNNPELYVNLGTAYDNAGQSEKSLQVYNDGIKNFPITLRLFLIKP